jgi:phosphatidylserine/phosphatidylglycerophosphate/cardiolipin synthase-like enzyme
MVAMIASMEPEIQVRTLTDGGQSVREIADAVAAFLDGAKRTLDLAQYDFELGPESGAVVGDAIKRAVGRGVRVRLAFNVDHRKPIPVPPPPSPDMSLIASLPVEAIPVAGVPDLMHHKYVIRDRESVWTGSLNWSDDAWSRQENVVVVVDSPELAADFERDFEQVIGSGTIAETGFVEPAWHGRVRAWFAPGHAPDLSHRIAQAIGLAERRVRICSPVITAGPILGAIAGAVGAGKIDIAGCVDQTQVRGVVYQWRENGKSTWKLPLLERVLAGAFTGKLSTPYGASSVHDFMHAKVTVVDEAVFIGSFNLSRSGEENAENVLEIDDAAIAERLASFVDEVRARYPRLELTT